MLTLPDGRKVAEWAGDLTESPEQCAKVFDSFPKMLFEFGSIPIAPNYENYICKWETPDLRYPLSKSAHKLMSNIRFSDGFINAINIRNLNDIYGIDDVNTLIDVFTALVMQEAYNQYHAQNTNNKIRQFISGLPQMRIHVESPYHLSWQRVYENAQAGSFIDFISNILQIPHLDAISSLVSIVGIKIKNLFSLLGEPHQSEKNRDFDFIDHLFDNISFYDNSIKFIQKEYIKGFANQTIGAFVAYQYNDNYFCLPATVSRGELSIGKYRSTAHFLNEVDIDRRDSTTVMIFQDMRVAMQVIWKLRAKGAYNTNEIIITSHLGTDLSLFNWEIFYNKDVIFVPAPTPESLAMSNLYMDHCKNVLAKSFMIADQFVLPFNKVYPEQIRDGSISPFEQHVLASSCSIQQQDDAYEFVNQLIGKSIPFEYFKNRYQELGVFYVETPPQTASTCLNGEQDDLPLLRSWGEAKGSSYVEASPLTIGDFFSKANTTLIYGATNVGKSWFAQQICIAACTGSAFMGLLPSLPMKCVYIDGELGEKKFQQNIRQLMNGLDESKLQLLDHNFITFHMSGAAQLLDMEDRLINELILQKVSILVIDNILSVIPSAAKGASAVLFRFLSRLKDNGIAPIIIHHANKTGKETLGSSEFESLSQNVIFLEEPRGKVCKGPHFFAILKKTKVAPQWQHEKIELRLTVGGVMEQCSNWPGYENYDASALSPSKLPTPDEVKIINSLPPGEREAYRYIRDYMGGVKREELDKYFCWSKNKTLKILKALCGKGILKTEGDNKATLYFPR